MGRHQIEAFGAAAAAVLFLLQAMASDKPASRRGSAEDRSGEQVTLTVNVTCSAKAGRNAGVFSSFDHVAITLIETCIYRITSWTDEGVTLERVSNTTRLSADGSGGTTTPPEKWSYLARQPVTPVSDVSLDPQSGTGQVDLSEFLNNVKTVHKGEVSDFSLSVALLDTAVSAAGSPRLVSGVHTSGGPSLGEQLKFKFKPDEKTVTGHGSCSLDYKQADGAYGEATVEVNFHLSLGQGTDIEAVITPVGDYLSWLPLGAAKASEPGNTIAFKVELRDRKTGGPPKGQTAQFEFQLHDTSTLPGSCMNSPWNDTDPDLRIRKEENPQLVDIAPDGQTAKSPEKVTSCTVTIACFDGAAFAGLMVVAQVRDGDSVSTVMGYLAKDQSDRVAIPYDLDGNGVADAWEKKHKVVGKDLNTDDDDQPSGDRDNGDGLTIWEEYRGFLEGGRYFRTDPATKDFFICDTIGGLVQRGIDRFAALTQLTVHSRLTLEELSEGRIINRNRQDDSPHVVDQHGVKTEGWCANGICRAEGGPGTPKSISRVLIDTSIQTVIERATASGEKKTYPYFELFVVHELLHCCNVWHHGDRDHKVYWRAEADGGQTHIYEYEHQADVGHKDRGVRVTVIDEADDLEFDPTDDLWSTVQKKWVGYQGGQHSGSDDCVMRYECADAYAVGNVRYSVGSGGEPVGLGLCRAPDGTGVNAPGRKPRPRYGDADEGRGDCVEKICVNDTYH